MKKLTTFFSYAVTALAACAVTLLLVSGHVSGTSKLDQIEALIESRFIEDADMAKAEDAAADAMIASLGDRWSYYLNAQDYATHKEQVENAYVGIGITITPAEDGSGFQIIAVQNGSGAQEAGLLAGDIVISAEGQSVLELTTSALREIIRGKEGTQVTLEVKRGEDTLSFPVTRTKILTEVVISQMLDGGIGLIAIHNFD